ncbi:NIPSNAP family protein [Marinomonas sp. 42_23_T18]|nr:NIPSNAP family protein [Marinomonas sp. 42_23_T18]
MMSCVIHYQVDANKLVEFEQYAKTWIGLVEKFGGQHQGYFLPSEGDNNLAIAIFTFSSLGAYEIYREASFGDAECLAAFEYAKTTACIVSYKRSFFRPVFS